ncbi:3-carboxy-cis,cis-muconate cycloisomerase [Streptomyces sp. HNM0575]|uniref:lyase family protein n=1 Tax=Streptomyces sp. HNM0575 TaxID=2716338 RepID=UPI00145D2125|nr:lyase family protein [Streptomyces sp. HNM0575]NLU71605.1 3-carboxy-cis,cis-muconate cycloisomerase [Streptomyces sp. HNM0575]
MLAPVRTGSAAESATGDTAVLQALLDAEAALTRAQASLGLAPAKAASAVTEAARADRFDVRGLALRARSGGNPVIPLVADLTDAVGPDAAPYVHRGTTSQDVLDTALMLVAARALDVVLPDLDRTARELAVTAAEHRDTPMPGRTLTQHAVPTTFGLKVAGWRSLVLDAADRLSAVRAALPVQLGGAAGTLAAFAAYAESGGEADAEPGNGPGTGSGTGTGSGSRTGTGTGTGSGTADGAGTDTGTDTGTADAGTADAGAGDGTGDGFRPSTGPGSHGPERESPYGAAHGVPATDLGLRLLAAYARELPLAEPPLPWHTLRTPVADLGSACAFACGALGKFAADVLVLSRSEIGEVGEGGGGGSSAMPHKTNPVRATLIAAAARQAPALASTLLSSLAAEDERPAGAWHAEWQPVRELLRLTGGSAHSAAELAEGLQVFPYRMHEHLALTEGLIVSERFTAALGPLLGRARARKLLDAASRKAVDEGITLDEALEEEEPALREMLSRERLRDLTDPTHYTGSAPALTDRALRRGPGPVRTRAEDGQEKRQQNGQDAGRPPAGRRAGHAAEEETVRDTGER